jgi:hypothetical protein
VARSQAMNVDLLVARIVDRILRRSGRELDVGVPDLGPITR